MQNLVGKIIFACHNRSPIVDLKPFLVLDQTSFALTVVSARGGVHSLYTETLALNGPGRWHIIAWNDQPEILGLIVADLTALLNDGEFNLTEDTAECARLTLANLDRLKARLEEETFSDPQLGQPFPADDEDWDDDFDPAAVDDSEDEARAAGEAAATAKEAQRAAQDRHLDSILDALLTPRGAPRSPSAKPPVVIRIIGGPDTLRALLG